MLFQVPGAANSVSLVLPDTGKYCVSLQLVLHADEVM